MRLLRFRFFYLLRGGSYALGGFRRKILADVLFMRCLGFIQGFLRSITALCKIQSLCNNIIPDLFSITGLEIYLLESYYGGAVIIAVFYACCFVAVGRIQQKPTTVYIGLNKSVF